MGAGGAAAMACGSSTTPTRGRTRSSPSRAARSRACAAHCASTAGSASARAGRACAVTEGHLLARPRERGLLWREGGVVYWMATGTLDKISVRGLRKTAAGLDRLGGAFAGSGDGDRYDTGAVIVTTATTVTAHVDWGAECFAADGSQRAGHAGSKRFTLLPRDGAAFTADLAGRGGRGPSRAPCARARSTSRCTRPGAPATRRATPDRSRSPRGRSSRSDARAGE